MAISMLFKSILFVLMTIWILRMSWPSLKSVRNHGFYRFFSWEIILVLFLMNMDYWFVDPLHPRQLLAWLLLAISLVLIWEGVRLFRRRGRIDPERSDPALVGVEKTTGLVTSGLYRYIRHPFYSSLLFLGWGIFLKNLTWIGLALAAANTTFLVLTAIREEEENIQYFGDSYRAYMQHTRRFIPFLI